MLWLAAVERLKLKYRTRLQHILRARQSFVEFQRLKRR
jgi:hypothetical protein